MTAEETLKLIDELRSRGATMVEVNGVKAIFGPPAPPKVELEPAAKRERDERRLRPRSFDDRLFGPLGIGEEPTS